MAVGREVTSFRIVHSRKAYSEVTFRQTTDNFLGASANAFERYGGVPETLVFNILKATIKNPA